MLTDRFILYRVVVMLALIYEFHFIAICAAARTVSHVFTSLLAIKCLRDAGEL